MSKEYAGLDYKLIKKKPCIKNKLNFIKLFLESNMLIVKLFTLVTV